MLSETFMYSTHVLHVQVEYVSVDDVSPDYVQKEKEIEMGKEDLANKPPQIREKIVEGRIAKRLAELALLEQAYIRDDKILVKDLVKQTIASIGEKVQVGIPFQVAPFISVHSSFDTCVITRWLNVWVFFHKIGLSIQSCPATNAKMLLQFCGFQ